MVPISEGGGRNPMSPLGGSKDKSKVTRGDISEHTKNVVKESKDIRKDILNADIPDPKKGASEKKTMLEKKAEVNVNPSSKTLHDFKAKTNKLKDNVKDKVPSIKQKSDLEKLDKSITGTSSKKSTFGRETSGVMSSKIGDQKTKSFGLNDQNKVSNNQKTPIEEKIEKQKDKGLSLDSDGSPSTIGKKEKKDEHKTIDEKKKDINKESNSLKEKKKDFKDKIRDRVDDRVDGILSYVPIIGDDQEDIKAKKDDLRKRAMGLKNHTDEVRKVKAKKKQQSQIDKEKDKVDGINSDIEAGKKLRASGLDETDWESRNKLKKAIEEKKKQQKKGLNNKKKALALTAEDRVTQAKEVARKAKKVAKKTEETAQKVGKGSLRLVRGLAQIIGLIAASWWILLLLLGTIFIIFIVMYLAGAFLSFVDREEKGQKEAENKENIYEEIQQEKGESGEFGDSLQDWEDVRRVFQPKTDADPFVPTSPIPHGIPVTGKISQGYCSTFFWKEKGIYPYNGNGYTWQTHWCQLNGNESYKSEAKKGTFLSIGTHGGVDIGAPKGTPILSTHKGKVLVAGTVPGWGGSVDVLGEDKDGNPLVTKYSHMSSITVKAGDDVLAGDELGKVGNTGNSKGFHLDYRVCTSNGEHKLVSPSRYLCYGRKEYGLSDLRDYKSKEDLIFSYMLNYEINGKSIAEDGEKYVGKYVKNGVSLGLDISDLRVDIEGLLNNLDLDGVDTSGLYSKEGIKLTDPADKKKTKLFYSKVGLERNVNPLLIMAIHYREKGGQVVNDNASSKCSSRGFSCKNEGVFGFFEDDAFQNVKNAFGIEMAEKYCTPSDSNWGGEGKHITYQQFENQVNCFSLSFKGYVKSHVVPEWWIRDWGNKIPEWEGKWKGNKEWSQYSLPFMETKNYFKLINGTEIDKGLLSGVVLKWNFGAPSYYWNNSDPSRDYSKPSGNYEGYIYVDGIPRRDRNDGVLKFSLDHQNEIIELLDTLKVGKKGSPACSGTTSSKNLGVYGPYKGPGPQKPGFDLSGLSKDQKLQFLSPCNNPINGLDNGGQALLRGYTILNPKNPNEPEVDESVQGR